MNWLKTLWNKLVNKTSISPTLVLVEEFDPTEVGRVFKNICISAGVRRKDLENHNIVAIFEEWYAGDMNEESVRQSILPFMREHGGSVNAKLNGKF